jgi:hypothetical protein
MRDSLFVLLWGIAAMIFLNSYRIAKPFNKAIFILLSLVFFIYGLWTRSNTIIALIPIAYGFITYKRKTKKRLLLIFSSVSICVCTLLGMQTINYKVLHAHNHFPTYKLKLLDIVGISKLSKENLLPKDILFNPNKDYDTLLAEYTSATIDDIYWRSKRPIIHEPNDELNRSVLIAWINAIKKHPAFYIQNRTKGFLNYLKINKRVGANEYRNVHFGIEMPNPVNIVVKDIPAKTYFIKIYDYFNSSIFFSPWLWLLINCVGFVTFLKMYLKRAQPIWRANALIQLSGILLLLSQFPIYQIDLDFRYTYWNIFVFLIGISSLFQNNTATLKKN